MVRTNFTYLPNVTELPIELICNVTGTVIAWEIGGTDYVLDSLTDGNLLGHNATGPNIVVNSPAGVTHVDGPIDVISTTV